ncbi:hypothetical protein [Marinobacter sp. ELB17]|uniref:hypothetical protein n=1 Tax=Marinobacter sp. ELB17 TaxID=270374 RepID=UPI0000F3B3B3|nr:hypothetical protein [Marinobacter sp. ELB17]EAZ98382.1 hypothetical protein MELB17_09153 [Marinobacter sp. ELB17]
MTEKTIRPKIVIPDLSMFGVDNFKDNYESFGPQERQVFWHTLIKIGFEVASGKGVSGSNYHRLLMMLNTTFPGVDIDRSIFDQMVPNIGIKSAESLETASTGRSRSSDSRTRDAKPAPALSSKELKRNSTSPTQEMPDLSAEGSESGRQNEDVESAVFDSSSQNGTDVEQVVSHGPSKSDPRKSQFSSLVV